jgi:hypothetical protein
MGNAELYGGTDIWSTNLGKGKKDLLTSDGMSPIGIGARGPRVANRLRSSKALHSILRPGALLSVPSTESDKHD